MSRDTSSNADQIDVRDLIERVEELEGERDASVTEGCSHMEDGGDDCAGCRQTWAESPDTEDDAKELAALSSLLDDLKGYGGDVQHNGDWYPGGLVADSYFEDYIREMAEDIHGNALRNAEWPFSCIDWERAATEAQQDYSSVEYDGVTFWYR